MHVSREPVVIIQGLLVPLLVLLVPLFHWGEPASGIVNAAILTVGGALAAAFVGVDQLLPLLAGVAKAVLAVFLAFGVDVPETTQAFILAATGVFLSFLGVRPQVTPKSSVSRVV